MKRIKMSAVEPAVESLPDEELLALCEAFLDEGAQEQLSQLLARQQEGTIGDAERLRLDQLLAAYRLGLVVKARAWKEAVVRGLKPRLSCVS